MAFIESSLVWGAIGGGVLFALNLIEQGRRPPEKRTDFKDLLFWFPLIAFPLLGAILATIHNDPEAPLKAITAFNLGISAPAILQTTANQTGAKTDKNAE